MLKYKSRVAWLSGMILISLTGTVFGQGSVSVDLGTTDISNGLTNVSCCDGNTMPANIGELDCRRNVNTGSDLYYYFAISNSFAFAGNNPDLYITIHYYDTGTGNLTLQYDATSSAYKIASSVALTNSNTWKLWSWHVTDGYFGDRQNGGADFRINRSTSGNFCLDLVYVRYFCANPPCVKMTPAQGPNVAGDGWRAIFEQSSQWTVTRSKVDIISNVDHIINDKFTDAELSTWLPQIRAWGKRFFVETGALKEWCKTAVNCFNINKPRWDRFQDLGGHIDGFVMDEPLTSVLMSKYGSTQYAYEQTAEWMKLVRQNYPTAQIGLIEAYPYNSYSSLQSFIINLNNRCAQIGTQGMDFFSLDADWRTFSGSDNWTTVKKQFENWCRARAIPFNLIYWASPTPNSTNDCDWYNYVIRQGNAYKNVGGAPEVYDIESWLNIPAATVPETGNCTFTRSVLDFVNQFVPQTCSGQCPYGGTPRAIPGIIQAEDYDIGGEGVAYHDLSTGNAGGQLRSDDVDIQVTTDSGGGHNVGWIDAGEWLEYTVNVPTSTNYTLKVRVASCCSGGAFHIELDGSNITGSRRFSSTGGWQNWTTVVVSNISMSAGNNKILRVVAETGGWNLNYIQISSGSSSSSVTIDLGDPDVGNGLTHVICCDGSTVPWPMGGRSCRANKDVTDYYFYFNISDSWAFQGNKPNLTFTIAYFDKDTGDFSLQYDATSSPYKQGPSIKFTNTNTWRTVTWSVTDAYCGNRQNGGSDFRLAYFNGVDFYIDIVTITNP